MAACHVCLFRFRRVGLLNCFLKRQQPNSSGWARRGFCDGFTSALHHLFLEFACLETSRKNEASALQEQVVRRPKCVTLELKFSILQDDWFHYVQPGTRHKMATKKKRKKKRCHFCKPQISSCVVYSETFRLLMFFDASCLLFVFKCIALAQERSRNESVGLS